MEGESSWREFLRNLEPHTHVTLVGPMCNHPHTAERPTVYVDGGSKFRGRKVLEEFPTIAVGDGDSSPGPLDVRLPPDKDFSDLAFVLRGLPETLREVQMIGFLGGRRDHEFMVLGEVNHFLQGKGKFTMVRLDKDLIAFSGGPLKMELEGRFSLAVLEPAALTVTGSCRYQLKKPTPLRPLSSHGLSNIGTGMVTVTSTAPCFLFL